MLLLLRVPQLLASMKAASLAICLAQTASAADTRGLRDHGIASQHTRWLDTADGAAWSATSLSGIVVDASVPGDLITDLEAAGYVGDPW